MRLKRKQFQSSMFIRLIHVKKNFLRKKSTVRPQEFVEIYLQNILEHGCTGLCLELVGFRQCTNIL
jgi:hypothetical protein